MNCKSRQYEFKLWRGVDLDGTLAHCDRWEGPEVIGEPIPKMLEFTKHLIELGKTEGYEVRIFTARACVPKDIKYVKEWLKKHGLPDLEVTNIKDHGLLMLYDDRVTQVERNTGEFI